MPDICAPQHSRVRRFKPDVHVGIHGVHALPLAACNAAILFIIRFLDFLFM
jgi:hypothetical protein